MFMCKLSVIFVTTLLSLYVSMMWSLRSIIQPCKYTPTSMRGITNRYRCSKHGNIRLFSNNIMQNSHENSSHKRPESNHLSLDANFAGNHPEIVIAHLQSRGGNTDLMKSVTELTNLKQQRSKWIMEGDHARNRRKTLSKDIGILMKSGKKEEAGVLKQQVEDASRIAEEADVQLVQIDQETNRIFSMIPNLLDDRIPEGKDDTDNVCVHSWHDDQRKIGDNYRWHDELALLLGGMDHDAAARIAGARFSVLTGPLARLERALIQYFLDFHGQRGYTEVSVPYIVSRSTLQGTGQLPKFEDDLFHITNHQISGEDAFLIPTAEVPVTNLFRDQILDKSVLPLKLVCHSPSFRAEAGSHGRDTRGLLRQHQFQKVELVKIVSPETSAQEHEQLTQDAEALLQSLQLPYRRMLLCAGDTGFSARICYDLEVWLPGQQAYREISSCSNCYDFQAKRMMLRYREHVHANTNTNNDDNNNNNNNNNNANANTKSGSRTSYVHTINGSGVAVGRALIAILENHQLPDGSVLIPEVLQPYMQNMKRLYPLQGLEAMKKHGAEGAKLAPYQNANLQGNDGQENH